MWGRRSAPREIKEKKPDRIFADTWHKSLWLKQELSVMEPGYLDDYRVVADEDGVQVLRRKTAIRPILEGAPGEADKADP